MNANERDEIAASVAAHAELGSRYDTAVAEGLVERIGEEIDKRIDAKIGGQARPGQPTPDLSRAPSTYRGPAAPTPAAPSAIPPPAPVPRRSSGLSGMVLGLGSMGLGVAATAVVTGRHISSPATVLMILLIWVAITIINLAHSQRKL